MLSDIVLHTGTAAPRLWLKENTTTRPMTMVAMCARPPQDGQTHEGQDFAVLFVILSSLMWYGLQPVSTETRNHVALWPLMPSSSPKIEGHSAINSYMSLRCTAVIRRVGIFSLLVIG